MTYAFFSPSDTDATTPLDLRNVTDRAEVSLSTAMRLVEDAMGELPREGYQVGCVLYYEHERDRLLRIFFAANAKSSASLNFHGVGLAPIKNTCAHIAVYRSR